MNGGVDHGLEFLLTFDGRVHNLAGGYRIKFVTSASTLHPDEAMACHIR